MNKYLIQTEKAMVKEWLKKNLKGLNAEDVGEIEHIIDYFNSKDCPSNLDAINYAMAVTKSNKWMYKNIQRGESIVEVETDTIVELDFGDGMRLVRMVTKDAYKREGALMSHCLGGYELDEGMQMYSLRDSFNKPHTTIEVRKENNEIHQIKGKGNGSIHPKYIKYVLKSLEHFGMNVRGSEIENLGYKNLESLDTGATEYIKSNFTGHKWLTFGGKEYFYVNSVLSSDKYRVKND